MKQIAHLYMDALSLLSVILSEAKDLSGARQSVEILRPPASE